jgi:hypothetical protein
MSGPTWAGVASRCSQLPESNWPVVLIFIRLLFSAAGIERMVWREQISQVAAEEFGSPYR